MNIREPKMSDFLLKQNRAKKTMDAMKKEKDRNVFIQLFSGYVKDKFGIEMDIGCDNLYQLAKISIAGAQNSGHAALEQRHDCHNISSPIKKLTLFFFHLERELGIEFDDRKLLEINTTEELAGYCYSLLGVKDV